MKPTTFRSCALAVLALAGCHSNQANQSAATVVCCSMTSLSHTRYGLGAGPPGGERHGKRLKLST